MNAVIDSTIEQEELEQDPTLESEDHFNLGRNPFDGTFGSSGIPPFITINGIIYDLEVINDDTYYWVGAPLLKATPRKPVFEFMAVVTNINYFSSARQAFAGLKEFIEANPVHYEET